MSFFVFAMVTGDALLRFSHNQEECDCLRNPKEPRFYCNSTSLLHRSLHPTNPKGGAVCPRPSRGYPGSLLPGCRAITTNKTKQNKASATTNPADKYSEPGRGAEIKTAADDRRTRTQRADERCPPPARVLVCAHVLTSSRPGRCGG